MRGSAARRWCTRCSKAVEPSSVACRLQRSEICGGAPVSEGSNYNVHNRNGWVLFGRSKSQAEVGRSGRRVLEQRARRQLFRRAKRGRSVPSPAVTYLAHIYRADRHRSHRSSRCVYNSLSGHGWNLGSAGEKTMSLARTATAPGQPPSSSCSKC
jgi:hypothetical protein